MVITDVVNRQYPHFLYIRTSEGEAQQDENGSWQETAGSWELHSRCREETNGKGTQLQTASGQFTTFSSLVQLPAGTERVAEGTEIVVTEEPIEAAVLEDQDYKAQAQLKGVIRISGECLKFDKGRLHSRLWV